MNFITNLSSCHVQIPALLYYSHIPAAIVSLLIGIEVFLKSRFSLLGKILFFMAVDFSLWCLSNLIVWTNYDSRLIMFVWSFFGLLYLLLYILSFYFVYVFIKKRDFPFAIKMIFFVLILPLIVLIPTTFNLSFFDSVFCEAAESYFYTHYYYYVSFVFFLIIVFFSVVSFLIEKNSQFKKQIAVLAFGISFFLFSFFVSGYLASSVDNFNLEQYGLFGMPIFMGFLAYLIVQYKAFNIQLLKAQALVVGLFILIGSQFFFIQNNTNRILNGITLFLAGSFGWWLVRSVKEEVKRKEQLEIISKQLANTNIKLKRLDEAKTEFISIASHQLRTPLTSIKGFISLIFEGLYGKYSDQIKDVLEKVYISNERLIKLVEDLLNISRIDSGRMTFQFEKNSITEVVNEVFSTMEMVAENKKLKLEYKKPTKDIGDLIFDKVKIREVISNFVDNAIKYTQSGFVQLELKELPETVQVVVSDSGVGIDKEDIEGIFEKFRRGREIGKIHSDGAGLGLYVCLKIANAHNAKVWAESEGKGKGSRFILELRKDFEGKDKQS